MEGDPVATFTALTDATEAQAAQYLTFAEDNIEAAVQLWFETGGSLATESATSQNPPPVPHLTRPSQPRSRGYAEDANGVVTIESDDEEDFDTIPDTADDEALARRLQQEMYGNGGQSPNQVRAPISRTTETLVGPGNVGFGGGYGGYDMAGDEDPEALMAQHMAQRQARQARAGIFNQRDTQASLWDDPEAHEENLARATGGMSTQSSRARNLADMFRPPFELMCHLSWEDAREEGKEKARWLLVNVQDNAIFDCQTLNRDLWKDERVTAVIRESFLFLQYSREKDRQSGYIQYYFGNSIDNEEAYPHIAIVDPRTGEQMKIWSGRPLPKVEAFVEALYNFLDRYSLDVAKKNPVAKRKAEQPKTFDIDRMTEEEMMEMAMQHSLGAAASGTPPKPADPDDLTRSMDLGSAGDVRAESSRNAGLLTPQVEEVEPQHGAASAFQKIASDRPHEEPPRGAPGTTALQFRYSGGRAIRRFALGDPVRTLYEWMKAESPVAENAGKSFELKFMGKDLIDVLEQSIEEAGLKNASVNVEWVED